MKNTPKDNGVSVGQIPAARKKLDEGAEVRRQEKEHAAAEAAKAKEEKRAAAAELKQQRLLAKEAERQAQAAEKQAKAAEAARIEAERAARTPPPMPQQSPLGLATIHQHPATTVRPIAHQPETVLLQVNPSMFRNSPIMFLISCGLCLIGIGIPILALWWWSCLAKTLIVSNERTTFRSGILSKFTSEVWHRDVRNVVITQTLFQRIFGVGDVGIASAGHAGIEIQVSGIPDPERVKQIIDDARRQLS
ncbi:MAG: PH domain-containing protein [Planctomycetota bacterium]|nr:PH domain-containing protein [Planctomycetota bacterium]